MMILLILQHATGIVNVGFEKVFLMQNPGIYQTADVIQTYVYRVGLAGGQIGYGSAVGSAQYRGVVALHGRGEQPGAQVHGPQPVVGATA